MGLTLLWHANPFRKERFGVHHHTRATAMNESITTRNQEMSLTEMAVELRAFLRALFNGRRLILRWMGIAGTIGLFLALASGEEYTAKTRILPYRSGAGSIGGLSGLAGLAGIRLPAGAGDQTITADLYPEVAKSQDFRLAIADTPLQFSSIDRRATTVEYFRDLRQKPLAELLFTYTVGLPRELLAMLQREPPSSVPVMDSVASGARIKVYGQKYMRLVRELDARLSVAIDKRTSIITITGRMPDAVAAADLVRASSELLMRRITEYETGKAGEQFRFVEEQFTRAKSRYDRAQRDRAMFDDRNRAVTMATGQIERDRLQREYDLAFEVYQQLSRELEQARIKMNQDTPAFTILEQVSVPTERTSPKRAQMVLIALFLGGFAGAVRVGLRFLLTIG